MYDMRDDVRVYDSARLSGRDPKNVLCSRSHVDDLLT